MYVKTPARLHLGFLDLNGSFGRIFGGIGVAISRPNVVVEAEPSEKLNISGCKSGHVRLLVERFIKRYKVRAGVTLKVKQVIPEHVGLGSETQLALAVAAALSRIFNIKASIRDLAVAMGRGEKSGVGAATFEHGGFIVEGGLRVEGEHQQNFKAFPPTLFYHPFPSDWFFVVAIPNVKRGFTDKEERAAFKSLPPMEAGDADRICRLTLMKLLPSLIEHDIESFGEALTLIQNLVGNYFAKVQGGIYSSHESGECAEYMLKLGAYGAGQSSWGPTVYGLIRGKAEAKKLQSDVQAFLNKSVGGEVFYTGANNRGAYIKVYMA